MNNITSMNACVLTQARQIENLRIAKPIPALGEVLVKVKYTGICGSDLSTYIGSHPYKTAPTVLGHEYSGEVVEVGPGVLNFRVGDRVCAAAYANCQHCQYCASGKPHLCIEKSSLNYRGWNGSFAEYVIARVHKLYHLPDAVGDEVGALVEPLSIGLHTAKLAGDLTGKTILVLGAGSIGLSIALVSKVMGAQEIYVTDIDFRKSDAVKDCGAQFISSTSLKDTLNKSGGEAIELKADVCFIAAGYSNAVSDALGLIRPGGKIVTVAYFSSDLSIDMNELVRREISLHGATLSSDEDFTEVIRWLALDKFDPSPLISHRLSLRESENGMKLMLDHTTLTGKIMLIAEGI